MFNILFYICALSCFTYLFVMYLVVGMDWYLTLAIAVAWFAVSVHLSEAVRLYRLKKNKRHY